MSLRLFMTIIIYILPISYISNNAFSTEICVINIGKAPILESEKYIK